MHSNILSGILFIGSMIQGIQNLVRIYKCSSDFLVNMLFINKLSAGLYLSRCLISCNDQSKADLKSLLIQKSPTYLSLIAK